MEASTPKTLVSAIRPKQPYPGLRPFEPEEWSIFFGREAMTDDVIRRLAAQRVVLIHGASGSGKSSLVRAGVLPKLARQHIRHGVKWLTCTMRPSGGPLWNLAREFARLEGRAEDLQRIGSIIRLFNRRGATLSSVVNSLDGFSGNRLCILVDQFEELFRFERETSREEAELFVELLIGEITGEDPNHKDSETAEPQDSSIHIAITMRSEFLGECARFNGFAEAVNRTQYLVPRLTREALLRAIRRPAQIYGGEVELELADRLVADVHGREDELPLIQHGLMLMWNTATMARPNEPVKLDTDQFERAGGLTKLLSDHADRVMAAAAPSDQLRKAAERLFRALTDINAEGRAIRRPQSFHDLVALCGIPAHALRVIISAFRSDGVSFLTPYFPAKIEDKTTIDISHEALIRCWTRIADPQNGWLRHEFQDGLLWRSLLIDARAFELNSKHILSPAATDQRVKWFAQENAPWSERYGGGWELVENLLQTSRRMATRSRRLQRLLMTPVIFAAAVGLAALVQVNFPRLPDGVFQGTVVVLLLLAVGWMIVLITQLAIDYTRQFILSKLVRSLLAPSTLIVLLFLIYLAATSGQNEAALGFLVFFMFCLAGSWIVVSAGRFVLKHSRLGIYLEKRRNARHDIH